METIEPKRFRSVLARYPTGVCIVTSINVSGAPIGMAIGSFTSASLDPPLVAFFPDRRSSTWTQIRAAGRFCVNVLSDRQAPVSRVFGARMDNKFDGIDYRLSPSGLPLLEGSVAWIDCELSAVHPAGDHDVVIGLVKALEVESDRQPLLFHRGEYRQSASLSSA